MACIGKADYVPTKGFENRKHVIGCGSNPILTLAKGDVPKLFTDFFWHVFGVWDLFHHGKGYINLDLFHPDIAESVILMEKHYKNNFSTEIAIIKYLEALLKKRSF